MTDGRRPVCEPSCISPAGAVAGRARQLLRLLALLSVLAAGGLLMAAATAVPGYRRTRRGTWAVGHTARWVLRALGVRVVVQGAPRSGPSLVVGNHGSWLDVLALAGCTRLQMVARSEVRSWPVVGAAAVRAGTIFLERDNWRSLPGTVGEITAALRSGQRVQVFPEATTGRGDGLGEFHRAAFQAAIDAAVVISPVTIQYAQDRRSGATVAVFPGYESLVDSLRRVLAARRLEVTVRWLPPILAIAGTGLDHLDRASVTRLTENAVAAGLAVPVVRRARPAATAAAAAPLSPEAVPGQISRRRMRPVAPR